MVGVQLRESFRWIFNDPRWQIKFFVQAVILIIPVLGWIALLGWMMRNLENLRDGRREVARNGFYIVDGAEMLLVFVLYAAPLLAPWYIMASFNATLNARAVQYPGLIAATWLSLLGGLAVLAWILPGMVVAVNRPGFLVDVGPHRLLRETIQDTRTIPAAALLVIAQVVGLLGFFCFGFGAIFTFVYASTAVAAVAAWWEQPFLRAAGQSAGLTAARPAAVGPSAVGPTLSPAQMAPPWAPPPAVVAPPSARPPENSLPLLRTVPPPPAVLHPPTEDEPPPVPEAEAVPPAVKQDSGPEPAPPDGQAPNRPPEPDGPPGV